MKKTKEKPIKIINQIIHSIKNNKRWHKFFATFLIVVIILAGTVLIYNQAYAEKIFPRIYINDYNFKGKTKIEAQKILQERIETIKNQQLTFEINSQNFTISLQEMSAEQPLINFDIASTINQAYNIGHGKNFWQNLSEQINTLIKTKNINPEFNINEKLLLEKIKNKLGPLEKPAQNSDFIMKEGKIIGVNKEKNGAILNYKKALAIIKESLNNLENIPIIKLSYTEVAPQITQKEAKKYIEPANQIIALAPTWLNYESDSWEVNNETLTKWLTLKINDKQIYIGIKSIVAQEFLQTIAEEINKNPQDAVFVYENNWVKKFKPHKNGIALDLENTILNIEQELIQNKNSQIKLAIHSTLPEITIEEINDFNIRELVGYGESDFVGSPHNRVHNIYNGAARLQGILIAPNEEFSLVKTLGEIDASTGYLPELVIKGDRTIPEYGGGLCQIGTTAFRMALGTGLPITERKNHTYRVSYYEPAGTDATIYMPRPDVKFINDTGNYLIFNTIIEGTTLKFELWGTKDGRTHSYTDPVIYNISYPGPTKYVETDELESGEEKCVEHAHCGADAYFDYTVTYPSGETKEERFSSHYVAWPKLCLVGKEPTEEDVKDKSEGEGENEGEDSKTAEVE